MCHRQLAQLRGAVNEVADLDAVVLAIDPHERWAAQALLKEVGLSTDDVNFPLLLDPTQTVSAAYGVACQMNIHVEVSNRPATFIIDQQGILRFEHRGQSFGDRPRPSEIVGELKKL